MIGPGGDTLLVPTGWVLLPPGDATLTRRVKKDGPAWTMKEKRGRRAFSKGIWAPGETIARVRAVLEVERRDPSYQRRLDAGRDRRAKEQDRYAGDFAAAVRSYLDFAPAFAELGEQVAQAIAAHAVPVGSGTVARTKRIPIEQRAEAATIAWLRHQTTQYDNMHIERVRGKRREVRRMLAQRSKELLRSYRQGAEVASESCLLRRALMRGTGKRKPVDLPSPPRVAGTSED